MTEPQDEVARIVHPADETRRQPQQQHQDARGYGARAQIEVTILVEVTDRWDGTCSVAQIEEQASEAAQNALVRQLAFQQNGSTAGGARFRILGGIKVHSIITRKES